MLNQNGLNNQVKFNRKSIANNVIEFQQIKKSSESFRKKAEELNVNLSTAQYWCDRVKDIPLPEDMISFFESSTGIDFLHRLVTALQYVMTEIGSCGIDLVSLVLKLSNLDYFVASSHGALQAKGKSLENEIINFAENTQDKLAKNMPYKKITIAEDETFHPRICLVAIEAVSNFILLEKYSKSRDANSWNKALDSSLENLNADVVQAVSDNAAGLINHIEKHLGANHSTDIFHLLYDISKATSASMASKVKSSETKYYEQKSKSIFNFILYLLNLNMDNPYVMALILYDFKYQVNLDIKVESEKLEKSRNEFNHIKDLQNNIKKHKNKLSTDYHPYDINTGKVITKQDLKKSINSNIKAITDVATEGELSDRSLAKIAKVSKASRKMINTMGFYWNNIFKIANDVCENITQRHLLIYILIPLYYFKITLNKTSDLNIKIKLKSRISELEFRLKTNKNWEVVHDNIKITLKKNAKICAELFQRSSSCVEGRNGYLSLRHHGLHNISDRKLKVLTAIHNYSIKRVDGTTAANRFFEQEHDDMFEHLLKVMPLPSRPKISRVIKNKIKLNIAA